ncbi:MAG: hypothetical protein Q9220_006398 [cf. Caloplaca sp. 1 TL-2023]
MAFIGHSALFRHFRADTEPDAAVFSPPQPDEVSKDSSSGFLGRLSHEVFKRDCLARELESHHITGAHVENASITLVRD